jgi:Periplasmic copper-binding protein (NosD)
MLFRGRGVASLVCLFVCTLSAPSKVRASATLVVGTDQTTCPGATFSQIQAAIHQAAPGDSVHVCQGVYPEPQLFINKPLHLNGDPGVFFVPPAFTQNANGLAMGAPIAAGILVAGANSVSITGITIDGVNNSINQCSPRLEGIYYQNSSGKVDAVVVTNMKLGPGLSGCQSGTGIFVESGNPGTSQVEIVNCKIHDFQKNGITANETGTFVSVHDNVVTGLGPTTGAAQNGIQVGFGATGKIVQNTVVNMIWAPCIDSNTCQAVATNILVAESDGVVVRDNTVSISQVGIFGDGNNETILRNGVSNSSVFDGIRVEGNGSKVLNNTVQTANEALIFVQGNDNDVVHNTLSEAPVGILKVSGSSDDKFKANDFKNVSREIVDPLPRSLTGLLVPER